MSADTEPADTPPAHTAPVYSERLWVPLWWWPLGLATSAVLAYTIHLGTRVPYWIPLVLLAPIPVWLLWWLSRHRVEVVPDSTGTLELRADRAHLPVTFVARAAAVPTAAKSAALGRQLDPAAFVQHRPWIGPMALLVLDDPDDPVPYWIISTRRPAQVLTALGVPTAG
jgi:hypothetical protein